MTMRTCLPRGAALAALLIACSVTGGVAQEPDEPKGPGARLGQQLDEVLREVRREFQGLSEEVQQKFARARSEVQALSVAGRVYGRLHWDKMLTDASIAVEIRDGGTAVLSGSVADATARAKAEALARDTVGVSSVINQLEIKPADEDEAPSAAPAP